MLNALPLLALLLFPASAIAGQAPLDDAFDPRAYPKKKATCRAVDRNGSPAPGDHPSKEIEIHYVDVNPEAERTLLLVHGWPSLWSTWSNQIQRFGKDYRLIIPDLRGFGPSTHPGDVEASGTIGDLVGDLVCVLENEKIDKSICVGHDWGAQLCWEGARMRPDVFDAVAGAVVPYLPSAGPFTPVEQLAAYLPKLSYQTYFEKHTQEAIKELDTDIRRTLRGTLRSAISPPPDKYLLSTTDFLEAWSDVPEIPPIPFMSEIEEDYLVEQYKIQGFGKTLQFYTYGNRYGSWDFSHSQANFSIPQPALYIAPLHDPVADWVLASHILHSADFIPNLKIETLPGHHWPQLEHPQEFNEILANWLATLHSPESSTTAEESAQETQETARQHQEL